MLKAKSGKKRPSPYMCIYIYNLVFPQYLGLLETLGEIPLHTQTTPDGAPTDEIRGKFNSRIFFNLPPNFDPKLTQIFDPQYLRNGGRYSHALFDSS